MIRRWHLVAKLSPWIGASLFTWMVPNNLPRIWPLPVGLVVSKIDDFKDTFKDAPKSVSYSHYSGLATLGWNVGAGVGLGLVVGLSVLGLCILGGCYFIGCGLGARKPGP
jgi:hypothetical protein